MKKVAAILGVLCVVVVLTLLAAAPALACGPEGEGMHAEGEGTHAEGQCTGHGATSASALGPLGGIAALGLVGGTIWVKRRRG